jgi:HlyD family secretion protein
MTPGTVVIFQSQANGQIAEWFVEVGDRIKENQLLATISQPLIEKQLEQAKIQLDETRRRNAVVAELTKNNAELEYAAVERQWETITSRIMILDDEIKKSRTLAESNRQRKEVSLDKNISNLDALISLEGTRLSEVQERLNRAQELRSQNLQTEDALVAARQAVNDQQLRLADLSRQAIEQRNAKVRAEDHYLQALNRIIEREDLVVDLTEQLKELEKRRLDIDKSKLEADLNWTSDESELLRRVETLERQLQENRQIRSEVSGVVLELTASRGKIISRGQRLGMIDKRTEDAPLEALAYFKLKDGKRIRPGMRLRLTPSTIQQERYGSLLATVREVSSFPMTSEGVANVVGNSAVASTLTDDGRQIQVIAELIKDPNSASGYAWNLSNGPETKITAGTIATSLVNLEEIPPISFVIPILRDWKGLEIPSWLKRQTKPLAR